MREDYIANYTDCNCGSPTYGWIVYKYNFELNKRIKSVQCGGCDKILPYIEKHFPLNVTENQ